MNPKSFTRRCPSCRATIRYTSRQNADNAARKNTLCASCRKPAIPRPPYERQCPTCKGTVKHRSYALLQAALKRNNECHTCATTRQHAEGKGKQRLVAEAPVYTRTCEECNETVTYVNYVSYLTALRKNRPCRSCAALNRRA